MMEEIQQLVADYMKGRLSPEAKAAFEQRCREDAAFAVEVRAITIALAQLDAIKQQQLETKLSRNFFRIQRRRRLGRLLLISAGVAIALFLFFLYFSGPREFLTKDPYEFNCAASGATAIVEEKPSEEMVERSFRQAVQLLQDGKWEEAKVRFRLAEKACHELLANNHCCDCQSSYYLGYIYARQGSIRAAEEQWRITMSFDGVPENPDGACQSAVERARKALQKLKTQ